MQNVAFVVKGAWKYDKFVFIYFGLYTVLSAIAPFISIFFPRFILQELLNAKRPEMLIILLAGFFSCASITGFLTAYLRNAYYPHMVKVRFEYIRMHQQKCMTTDFQNTEDPQFLNDMQTAFRCLDNNNIGIEGVLHKLFGFAGNILALLGYITIVATLNIFVLMYLIANVIISYYLTFLARKFEHSKKDEISENDRRSQYLYNIMYDFAYGKELRILGIRDWIAELFKLYKERRLKIHREIRLKYFKAGIADTLLLLIREGIIYAYLISLVIAGKLSIPDFTMYFTTIAQFASWFTNVINDIAHIRAQNLYICDFRSFIEKQDIMASDDTVPLPEGPYEFEFRNVSFKYPNSNTYIFKDLSIRIPAGQKLAIVGHNGAGKTTFVKLLCRLYDVTEGEILLNGINIKRFNREEYYKLFSVVFQDIKPLAFSVAENVAVCEKKNIDHEKLKSALEQAGIWNKICSLKNGVDTSMLKILDDDGVEFSGGENQKIAIARALYKDAPIVVLDEPTAALDALAEYSIYMSFNRMVKNKTAIYISHRLASTRFCDAIAMFENGKLVEYGTHDELIALNGKYADMFTVQAKYYREEVAV
nr:ABC transporter ATP-binding protein [Caldicoprobacter guelmensis]